MFTKSESRTSKTGKAQDIYRSGSETLIVCGDRGALRTDKGVKKVTVSISGNIATITEERSGFLPDGHMAQDWLNRKE